MFEIIEFNRCLGESKKQTSILINIQNIQTICFCLKLSVII